MANEKELKEVRIEKREKLESLGINPYPSKCDKTHDIISVIDNFKEGEEVTLAGRVMSLRGQGSIMFSDIYDGTGKFQIVLKEDVEITYSGKEIKDGFELLKDTVDIGDFVEVSGALFVTKRGAESLEVKSWRMLSKAILPIPTEHFGLKDDDERYRKRYLDILSNPELREMIEKKSKFWKVMREFMESKGFMEVETPTLEVTTGGAEARPFKTHHNDYGMDVFLRISVGELWQKRLMAAGFPKTFEIGRVFRNEGSSPEHLQEFTNMEFYWAYANYKDGMELVKEMYKKIANDVFGKTKFEIRGYEFDLSDEWEEIDYVSKIKEVTGIDVLTATVDDMKDKAKELGIRWDGDNKERLSDTLWKYCRKQISGPAFLINHPVEVAPLAKLNNDKPGRVEEFQPIIAGSEVGKGYSELNDPVDQSERFQRQQKMLMEGDEEAMMAEWGFVEMLEHGMPPTCGFGCGERLFSFLAGVSIREAQAFPLMKPKG
jgi:lysyl-tRNA synthetase class 2